MAPGYTRMCLRNSRSQTTNCAYKSKYGRLLKSCTYCHDQEETKPSGSNTPKSSPNGCPIPLRKSRRQANLSANYLRKQKDDPSCTSFLIPIKEEKEIVDDEPAVKSPLRGTRSGVLRKKRPTVLKKLPVPKEILISIFGGLTLTKPDFNRESLKPFKCNHIKKVFYCSTLTTRDMLVFRFKFYDCDSVKENLNLLLDNISVAPTVRRRPKNGHHSPKTFTTSYFLTRPPETRLRICQKQFCMILSLKRATVEKAIKYFISNGSFSEMTSIKEDRDDSEGDEMEHESAESEKSSSSSDSSDGSDTDDSSELDGEECERRRNECLEALTEMERQFLILREQLYKERIAQIKEKLEEVHEGTAKEYRVPLEELEEAMRIRIEVAGVLKKLRLESIDNHFEAEELAAKQNFENEKSLLIDTLKEELEERIRRLEEERHSVDFQPDSFYADGKAKASSGGATSQAKGRGSWRKGHRPDTGRRKPVTVSGPYVVYQLTEEEILEDWTVIKKALQSHKRSVQNERKPYHRYV